MRWIRCSDYTLNRIKPLYALFGIFALTACGEPIKVNAPPPPREWLQCAPMPESPALDPLAAYREADNSLIYRKGDVDARDSVIARYIVAMRAAHLDCENALERLRDYYDGVE